MEMDYETMLAEFDRRFEAGQVPDLTEEELQKIEEGAENWLMGCQGIL